MNDLLLVLVVGLVIVGALFAFRTRAGVSGMAAAARAAQHTILSRPVDPRVVSLVVALLGKNKKIQAIKELRQATGLGLKDAKDLVEAMQRGHRPPTEVIPGEAVDVTVDPRTPTAPSAWSVGGGDGSVAERARALRDQGRELEAIKLVREETGMGLVEAQKFVRALG